MAVGQRALTLWTLTLLVLIFLIIYLDGGLEREPLVLFILLALMDLLVLASVALRCARYYLYGSNRRGANDEDTALLSDMPRLDYRKSALASAAIVFKLAFETLLCVQMRWRLFSNLLFIFAPLWASLSIVVVELGRQIVEVHKKAI